MTDPHDESVAVKGSIHNRVVARKLRTTSEEDSEPMDRAPVGEIDQAVMNLGRVRLPIIKYSVGVRLAVTIGMGTASNHSNMASYSVSRRIKAGPEANFARL